MNERVLPMWTESDKQNKTEENNNKNRTFIKYSWKYSSVSVMVLRRRFRLPLPFCHVTHCIHEIPFWQSNFFFRSHLVLVIYLHLNRKKTWGVEKSLYFTKIDEQKKKKKSTITNRTTVSPFNFNANFWQNKKIRTNTDDIHEMSMNFCTYIVRALNVNRLN